jgi:replicative DNA helicase
MAFDPSGFSSPYDRVPPNNMEAEQAVLGSMLIERSAVDKAAEILRPDDFYRDAHRFVFEAMLNLAERDQPVDPIFLENELKARGQFEQVGGMVYIFNLMEAPSTAANIEYYSRLVEEKAILRRLLHAGTEIQGLAFGEFETVTDVIDRAEKIVFEVGQKRMGQFFSPLRPLLDEELDRIEKRYENKGITTGRMTPFDDLNYMTAGLQPSDLIIVAARPSMGKCLTARARLVDPQTGKRITIEDAVQQRQATVFGLSALGVVRETAVSDWIDSGVKPCFRVTTRTGRTVEVTGHHPFLTVRGWTPLHDLSAGSRIAIPRTVPAFGTDTSLSLDRVRLLAYFIAEGGLTGTCPKFTNTDPEIIADFHRIIAAEFPTCVIRQEKISYKVVRPTRIEWRNSPNPLTQWLAEMGQWGKYGDAKFFPNAVWQWDKERLALFLRVLMSCDGTIYRMGGFPRIEFAVASGRLADDLQHALTRFGIVAKRWQKKPRCWRVEITEPESVARYQQEIGWFGEKAGRFGSKFGMRRSNTGHAPPEIWNTVRDAARQAGISLAELARRSGEYVSAAGYNPHTNRGLPQNRLRAYANVLNDEKLRFFGGHDIYWDEIAQIEFIGDQQVYDLTVPEGANFIAEDICVHNTALTVQLGQYIALNEKKPCAIFSLEMSKEQLVTRMICSESKVDAHSLRTGYLRSDDWQRVGEGISRLAEAPIFIDDTPEISAMEMRTKCRRLKSEHGELGLIIIDYLQLMRSHKRTENRNQELSDISRACKGLARELKVPVIALSQLSRAVEQRPDKRPMLSDLRESGAIEAEADVVMFIYREAYYKSKERVEAEDGEAQQQQPGVENIEEAELIIAKQRNGPTGRVHVGFMPHYARFENLDRTHHARDDE